MICTKTKKMNLETALQIVDERLLGENSIPVKIRSKEKLSENEYPELITAIHFLIDYYKDTENIPRKLALAFVDISNYFFISNHNYSEKEIELFEDYGIELSRLAEELFSNE